MLHKIFTASALMIVVFLFFVEKASATDPNISTVDSTGDVGDVPRIDCSTGADDCKIVYFADGNDDVKFVDCGDATCSSGNATIGVVDSSASFAGFSVSLDCSAGTNDCKVIYYDDTLVDHLVFADCEDAECSSGNANFNDVDTDGGTGWDNAIDCSPGGVSDPTNCKIAYIDATTSLKFADCGDATCTSGNATISTLDTGDFDTPSIDCPTEDDCKIAYYDAGNNDLKFIDCGDATCTSGNATITTIVEGGGQNPSIVCPSATDCKIAYFDGDLKFVDCGDATCTSGNATITAVDSTGTVGRQPSMVCLTANDCKIAYRSSSNALKFVDCGDATCTSGNATFATVDDSAVMVQPSMDCPAADDCKIAYHNFSSDDLKFADCEDEYCGGTPAGAVCGNGSIETGEECDDGGTSDSDGCSSTCTVESGYSCSGEPSSCSTVCGDSIVAGSEECDDGNSSDNDLCLNSCEDAACGDSAICSLASDCNTGPSSGVEECDDGGTTDGDGCSSSCGLETGWQCAGTSCNPICGDSLLYGSEQCDDGNTKNGDGCSSTCTIESGYACTGTNKSTCVNKGIGGPKTTASSPTAQGSSSSNVLSCGDPGYTPKLPLQQCNPPSTTKCVLGLQFTCTASCTWSLTGCTASSSSSTISTLSSSSQGPCGNGILETGEDCDPPGSNVTSCVGGTQFTCNAQCKSVLSSCGSTSSSSSLSSSESSTSSSESSSTSYSSSESSSLSSNSTSSYSSESSTSSSLSESSSSFSSESFSSESISTSSESSSVSSESSSSSLPLCTPRTQPSAICGNGIVEPPEECEGTVNCDIYCKRIGGSGSSQMTVNTNSFSSGGANSSSSEASSEATKAFLGFNLRTYCCSDRTTQTCIEKNAFANVTIASGCEGGTLGFTIGYGDLNTCTNECREEKKSSFFQTYCCVDPAAKDLDTMCPRKFGIFNLNPRFGSCSGTQGECGQKCSL